MTEGIGDIFCDTDAYENFFKTSKNDKLWNGRQTAIIDALETLAFLQSLSDHNDQRRLEYFRQSILQNLPTNESNFTFADPTYSKEFTYASAAGLKIEHCGLWKDALKAAKGSWKGLKNAGKHVGHALGKAGKKSAHETAKFVHNHKKEILLGVAVLVAAAAVAGIVVAVASGAAAGAATNNDDDKKKKAPDDPKTPTASGPNPPPDKPQNVPDIFVSTIQNLSGIAPAVNFDSWRTLNQPTAVPPPPEWKEMGQRVFLDKGIMMDGKLYPYVELQQKARFEEFINDLHTEPPPSVSSDKRPFMALCEMFARGVCEPDPDVPPVQISLPNLKPVAEAIGCATINNFGETSRIHYTPGIRDRSLGFGICNGMRTSFQEALKNAGRITEFAPGRSIICFYNQDHGAIGNIAEIFGLNYFGVSPNIADLMQSEWTSFHEANKDNPDAKFLHFCTSQGAIHTKNALQNSPQEIRDRVIVVAIAPAAIVPKRLCYDSFNYASENDMVPYGDVILPSFLNTNEYGDENAFQIALKDHKELILLKPHPNAKGWDHRYLSETYAPVIEQRLKEYLIRKGIYKKHK